MQVFTYEKYMSVLPSETYLQKSERINAYLEDLNRKNAILEDKEAEKSIS